MSFKKKEEGGLPSEYQQVEYIESDGTQYIATDYIPNGNTEIIIKFFDDTRNQNENYFGSDPQFRLYRRATWAQYIWIENNVPHYFEDNITTIENLKFNKNGVYRNEELIVSAPYDNINTTWNLLIFQGRYNNRLDKYAICKLYTFKILENEILLYDFVPCYRKSDNISGLYDLINGVFYRDVNGNNFIVGSEV